MNQVVLSFNEVRKQQQAIDRIQSESVALVRTILERIGERRHYALQHARLLDAYRILQASHIEVSSALSQNSTAVNSLQSVSCAIGNLLMNRTDNQDLHAYLRKDCVVLESTPGTARQPSPKRRRRKGAQGQRRHELPTGPYDILVACQPHQYLVAMELALVSCESKEARHVPTAKQSLSELREQIYEHVRKLQDWRTANFGEIRKYGNAMLRKEMASKLVQTTLIQRQDQSVETEPPRKSKW